VNEAWLKLAASPDVGATSRLHFKRIAARTMRQLLVEAARRSLRRLGADGDVEATVEAALPLVADRERIERKATRVKLTRGLECRRDVEVSDEPAEGLSGFEVR